MTDWLLYIAIILGALAVAGIVRLEFKLRKLLAGKKAETLEDLIMEINADLDRQDEFNKKIEHAIEDLDTRARRSVQSVKTLRYNPFQDSGSNQSFAIAFTDEEGNGVVLSSLYSRERMSVYAKPLKQYQSEHELTDEERLVIEERQKI